MSRRSFILAVLACFALFIAASSGLLHRHDGAVRSDVGCIACAAAGLAVVSAPAPATCVAPPEAPRPAPQLTLVIPRRQDLRSLEARGPPAL